VLGVPLRRTHRRLLSTVNTFTLAKKIYKQKQCQRTDWTSYPETEMKSLDFIIAVMYISWVDIVSTLKRCSRRNCDHWSSNIRLPLWASICVNIETHLNTSWRWISTWREVLWHEPKLPQSVDIVQWISEVSLKPAQFIVVRDPKSATDNNHQVPQTFDPICNTISGQNKGA